jgi:putative membrane protein
VESYAYDVYQSDGTERPSLWKGVVAGLAGGLVATWAMGLIPKPSPEPQQAKSDDATVKTASAISEHVAGHHLTRQEKKVAGPAVHWAFGTTMGGVYGAIAEAWPLARRGWGVPFGTALWLGADEVAVPSFGLGPKPSETPGSLHAWALAAHLVYGFTADTVRRAVRAAL